MEELDAVNQAIAEVVDGNRDAYRIVVEELESNIRLLLAGILPSRDMIDDLTQEVFVQAYLKIHDYTLGTNFKAWLRAIARNLALNARRTWFRRNNRFELTEEIDEMLTAEIEEIAPDYAEFASKTLRGCIDKLASNAQAITKAYYFQNRTSPEIAEANGKSQTWVRVILHRSRIALGKCLEKEGLRSHA